jgi:hypothetical protein
MIQREIVEQIIIECDRCHVGRFTGDYGETQEEIVMFAQSRGWEVYDAPGMTRCPRCLCAEKAQSVGAVDPQGGSTPDGPRATDSSSSSEVIQ